MIVKFKNKVINKSKKYKSDFKRIKKHVVAFFKEKGKMKKLANIMTVLLLSLILTTPASALNSSVYFLGQADSFVFHPGTSWSETDLFDGFKNAMPGDTLTETVSVRNSANDCDYVKIYLKADSLNNPTMSDFLAQLQMKVTQSGSVIYESSPNQTDGLTDYTLLGQFNPGDSADLAIELKVPLSLDNEYMHRSGEVVWTFLAECYEDDEIVNPPEPDNPDEPDTPVVPDEPSAPDTPDTPTPVKPDKPNTPRTIDLIIRYAVIFAISLLGLIAAINTIRRAKSEKDQA